MILFRVGISLTVPNNKSAPGLNLAARMAGRRSHNERETARGPRRGLGEGSRLHRGHLYQPPTEGQFIAAGTLRLGPKELSDLLKTIHASNTTNTFESVQAVAKFLKFFLGEIWHSFL